MAAIPRELIESELFGHEKGAFTGAAQRFAGRFEQAQGGTLFLDEIGDMPMEAQTRLLRVLQEGEYTTVGGRTALKADVRIIAATHRELRQLIGQGSFREDLYYRLNVVPVRLPPLARTPRRHRGPDEPFPRRLRGRGLARKRLTRDALERLRRYRWPGNVRELENLVRRIAAIYVDETITAEIVERELENGAPPIGEAEGLSRSTRWRCRSSPPASSSAVRRLRPRPAADRAVPANLARGRGAADHRGPCRHGGESVARRGASGHQPQHLARPHPRARASGGALVGVMATTLQPSCPGPKPGIHSVEVSLVGACRAGSPGHARRCRFG
jgi:DNA-binding NtrC family response regulator